MRLKKVLAQQGFTIVELMIATAVFTVVLLLCTFALLQVGKTYYKGITSAQTQNTTRAIVDDISQAIQFSGTTVSTTIDRSASPVTYNKQFNTFYCLLLGGKRYIYKLGVQVDSNPTSGDQDVHGLVWDEHAGNCSTAISSWPAGATELLGPHMRLADFTIDQITPGDPSWYIVRIRVVYGDSDLLDDKLTLDGTVPPDGILDTCRIGAGSQFCASSEITTSAQRRI